MAATERAKKQRQVWVPRIYRFLEERGGVAPKSAVIEEGMRYVPGGVAYRVGLQKRTIDSSYRNFGVERQLHKSDATTLRRAGANKIVCNSIYYERKAKRIQEFKGPDGHKWLRDCRE